MRAKGTPLRSAVVVGATSAVAGEVTRLLAQGACRLALIGRDPDKLQALISGLPASQVAFSRSGDFTRVEDNQELLQSAWDALGGADLVLIAHGYLGDQLRSEEHFEEAQKTIDVNLTSVISFVVPAANLLEAEKSGHLAVISSVAAERGRPRNYTYGAAKAAVTTYLQGVRSRLWPQVQVHTIKLGPVDTPMTVNHEKNFSFISARQAAQGIVQAIQKGQAEAYIPSFWMPVMAAVRLMPEAWFQRLTFLSGR